MHAYNAVRKNPPSWIFVKTKFRDEFEFRQAATAMEWETAASDIPKDDPWEMFEESLSEFTEDYMKGERIQHPLEPGQEW